jgi:hypothetical protein
MNLDIEKLQELCKTAREHLGTDCIISGGAVRDTLHGREVKDIDIFARFGVEETKEGGQFLARCQFLADHWKAHPGGENIRLDYKSHPANKSGGSIANLVDIVGTPIPVQVIALHRDPVDDVQDYDFALSQCFVTPRGLFYTERYLGDANALTVTYVGSNPIDSAGFKRSVLRYQRLKAKYAPEFTFQNCEMLDKAIADAIL